MQHRRFELLRPVRRERERDCGNPTLSCRYERTRWQREDSVRGVEPEKARETLAFVVSCCRSYCLQEVACAVSYCDGPRGEEQNFVACFVEVVEYVSDPIVCVLVAHEVCAVPEEVGPRNSAIDIAHNDPVRVLPQVDACMYVEQRTVSTKLISHNITARNQHLPKRPDPFCARAQLPAIKRAPVVLVHRHHQRRLGFIDEYFHASALREGGEREREREREEGESARTHARASSRTSQQSLEKDDKEEAWKRGL